MRRPKRRCRPAASRSRGGIIAARSRVGGAAHDRARAEGAVLRAGDVGAIAFGAAAD